MATSYKVLGQTQGTAALTTYSTLYTVPENTQVIISTISVCNTDTQDHTFRIAISDSATPTASKWIVYNSTVASEDSAFITISLTMDSTNKYLVISSNSNLVSFSAFGSEIS